MKIALTGGSGFVGTSLSRVLGGRGLEIVSLSRKDADVTKDIYGIFNGCDCVIHLVGIIREKGQSFHDVMVLGTQNVVRECKRAGVKKIVYVSALGVSEDRRERYYKAKLGAEREVIASGIPYAIIRPSVVYGPGSDLIKTLGKMLSLPVFPVFGDGKYELQPIHVDDLSECIANAISKAGIFEVGGAEKISFESLLRKISSEIGKGPFFIHIPLWLSRAIVAVISILPFSPVTTEQLEMMIGGNVCTKNDAIELGVSPRPLGEITLQSVSLV